MYRISELADLVGLSRTALLYYEKQGLIQGKRLENSYRVYSDKDVQRVRLIQKLQAGGLTLKECKACLNAKVDRELLQSRLKQLDEEIAHKQQSRQLLAALLGEGDLKAWHESVDTIAPDAHLEWLIKQGFSEKEALHLKWLSKDMNEHDRYMADFMRVFETLDRWGPGSEEETFRALSSAKFSPKTLLEIGCGKGIATTVLAKHTDAAITALDNEPSVLNRLNERAAELGFSGRIRTVNASMTELPFDPESFDLIWAEGCAYIMGVENALKQWRKVLKHDGVLVLSDLVWLTDTPSDETKAFWLQEYPDIGSISRREEQAKATGYEIIESFTLAPEAWENYFKPLEKRVNALKADMPESAALKDIQAELNIYNRYLNEFSYQVFVLKKKGR
ncbi:MerR family transcriptional regulator [Grimontia kaedaensis]|uniref:MerR family transcriptional regulator n=1 Tax=Grimontia kaedaensis TaxID=2872157 RepID=A0ABY4WZH6_9GAMM|nr:MerR family transcriptional regulator [Grimontia kaedaensis]USH04413.1 MerR family transcriptional regulator [Grimontia kaedaensis]